MCGPRFLGVESELDPVLNKVSGPGVRVDMPLKKVPEGCHFRRALEDLVAKVTFGLGTKG